MTELSDHEDQFPHEGMGLKDPTPEEAIGMFHEDFAGLPAAEQVREARREIDLMIHGYDGFSNSGDTRHLPAYILERVKSYDEATAALHDEVTSIEAQNLLKAISSRYIRPGLGALPENLEELRANSSRMLVFDFDGTISVPRGEGLKYDPLLAGSDPLDGFLGKERTNLKYSMALWEDVVQRYPDTFAAGGAQVSIRPGMQDLLTQAIGGGVGVTILTTNFEPFMKAFVKRIEGGDNINIISIKKGDATSIAKGDKLLELAMKNPKSVIEYIGDGESDTPALNAAPVIAAYHAVSDLPFARRLNERGIKHFQFKSGDELGRNLGINRAA